MKTPVRLHIDHWQKVTETYDEDYAEMHSTMASFILKNFPILPHDRVIDLGGGTGGLAHRLWKQAGLHQPILCIDPSSAMLEQARLKEGVTPVFSTAEDFLSSKPKQEFNKVISFAAMRYFNDQMFVLKKLLEYLPENGACIFTFWHPDLSIPLFKSAVNLMNTKNRQEFRSRQVELFKDIGFKFEEVIGVETHLIAKKKWYQMFRNRFISVLEQLSDVEIEKGIEELEEEFQGKEVIEITQKYWGLKFTKVTMY